MSQNKSSKEIRSFAIDLYDYIWTKHTFSSLTLEKYLTANLCLQLERTGEGKSIHFNVAIGKAVLCSQYLLRQFCFDFFTCMGKCFVYSGYFFKFHIFLILYKWTHYRSNVFIKVLDCCAIIAEAFLFLETKTDICEEIRFAPELFSQFFECNLATEFFDKGGWEELTKIADSQYLFLYLILEDYIDSVNAPYSTIAYNEVLIDALRDSIMFPISYSEFLENDVATFDDEKIIDFIHDRSLAEIFEQSYASNLVPAISTEIPINSLIEDAPETKFTYVLVGDLTQDFEESCNLSDGKLSSKKRRKRKSKKLPIKKVTEQ